MRYLFALLVILGLSAAYVYVRTPYETLTLGSDYLKTPGDYYTTPNKTPAYDAIQRSFNRVLCVDDASVTKGRVVHFIEQTNGCYGFSYETGAASLGPHQPSSTAIIDVSDPAVVKALLKQATPYPAAKGSPCSDEGSGT